MSRSQMLPNSTQIPDVMLDEWMPALSGAEWKVACYIARRTYGWRKAADTISIKQLVHGVMRKDGTTADGGTGLSERAVHYALNSLTDRGAVLAEARTDAKGGHLPTLYSLNLDWHPGTLTPPRDGPEGATDAPERVQPLDQTGATSAPGAVQKSDRPPACGEVQPVHPQHPESQHPGEQHPVIQHPATTTALGESCARPRNGSDAEEDRKAVVVVALTRKGICERDALKCVAERPLADIERQLHYHDHRPQPKTGTRAGQLLASILQGWAPPDGYAEALARQEAAKRQRAEAKVEEQRQEDRALHHALLLRLYGDLGEAERAALDAEAARIAAAEFDSPGIWRELPKTCRESLIEEARLALIAQRNALAIA